MKCNYFIYLITLVTNYFAGSDHVAFRSTTSVFMCLKLECGNNTKNKLFCILLFRTFKRYVDRFFQHTIF